MMSRQEGNGTADRLKIQETALSNLADSQKKHAADAGEELHDIQRELKALKLFLARNIPEFKMQFPEIRRKLG